ICLQDREEPHHEMRASAHYSRMNVTSSVTRYSVIFPSSTLPLSEDTSNPVTPRKLCVARSNPSSAACWNPLGDAAVILVTLATAMTDLLVARWRSKF